MNYEIISLMKNRKRQFILRAIDEAKFTEIYM